MGVQRYVLRSGAVRYRARVKFHGREVANRVLSAGPARSPGSRTSGGGYGLGSGLILDVARFRCRMWRLIG